MGQWYLSFIVAALAALSVTVEADDYTPNYWTGTVCKMSCSGLSDGMYQSCFGCDIALDCVDGENQGYACPGSNIWDQNELKCVRPGKSTTCRDDGCWQNDACGDDGYCITASSGLSGKYVCKCKDGFYGRYCEHSCP